MKDSAPVASLELALTQLPPGKCAVVRRVESESEDIERLKMLGVCLGRRVEVVKAGDPMIIRVFSSRIGISASLAGRVWLEACAPDHCALQTPA